MNIILSSLESIKSDHSPIPAHPVTYFSSLDRTEWARAREELISIGSNAELIKQIDSALFVVCLDESRPELEEDIISLFLHNNGHNR